MSRSNTSVDGVSKQRGFTLIEVTIALALVGITVVGLLSIIAASARTSARGRESATLLRLARAQVESIHQSAYQTNPANYVLIAPIPEGFSISVTSTDPGTAYSYPGGTPGPVSGSVQQITVTAAGDFSSMSMTFYKIEAP